MSTGEKLQVQSELFISHLVNDIEGHQKEIESQKLSEELEKNRLLAQNLTLIFDEAINLAKAQINSETLTFINKSNELLQLSASKVKNCSKQFDKTLEFQKLSIVQQINYLGNKENQENFIFFNEVAQVKQSLTEFFTQFQSLIEKQLKKVTLITKKICDLCEQQQEQQKVVEKLNQNNFDLIQQEQPKSSSETISYEISTESNKIYEIKNNLDMQVQKVHPLHYEEEEYKSQNSISLRGYIN